MLLSNDIILRPKFKIKIQRYHESILSDFENTKTIQSKFRVKRIHNHIYIKFQKEKYHFWSPQLRLKIIKINENTSILHGLFGPTPRIWLLFITSHFIIASFFILFTFWAYNNWTLKQSFAAQVCGSLLMILLWVTFYFAGSISKATNTSSMRLLYNFMSEIIDKEEE